MYGLFKNSYDYYEWHDLIAVSENIEKLIARHDSIGDGYPLITDNKKRIKAKNNETYHYVIEEVECI